MCMAVVYVSVAYVHMCICTPASVCTEATGACQVSLTILHFIPLRRSLLGPDARQGTNHKDPVSALDSSGVGNPRCHTQLSFSRCLSQT